MDKIKIAIKRKGNDWWIEGNGRNILLSKASELLLQAKTFGTIWTGGELFDEYPAQGIGFQREERVEYVTFPKATQFDWKRDPLDDIVRRIKKRREIVKAAFDTEMIVLDEIEIQEEEEEWPERN